MRWTILFLRGSPEAVQINFSGGKAGRGATLIAPRNYNLFTIR